MITRSKKIEYLLKQQKVVWDRVERAAGPRYSADLNVELPIKELFEGIGRTDTFFVEISELSEKLEEEFRPIRNLKAMEYKDLDIQRNLVKVQSYGEQFRETFSTLLKSRHTVLNFDEVRKLADRCINLCYPIMSKIGDFEHQEEQQMREDLKRDNKEYFGYPKSEELQSLKNLEHFLRDFLRASRDIEYFSRTSKGCLANNPFLVILGEAGIGKTHLMCDVAKKRIERNLPPTFVVLGEELLNIGDPLISIMRACGIKGGKNTFLSQLNAIGEKSKSRALIIVDAINEADSIGWKRGLNKMIEEIRMYPWIGLVMTCRIPFQFLALPKRLNVITEVHQGFIEYELEAMDAFFKFYGLPLPEVPLMVSEFSNPLFLGSFCKTAKEIKGGKGLIAKRLNDLALGQSGMTKILEDFYIDKQDEISRKYSGRYQKVIKPSWIWSKVGNRCFVKILAKEMAVTGKRYVDNSVVIGIINNLSESYYSNKSCQKIANILIEFGILIKDIAWDGSNNRHKDVIKFSFHKFSDHIIARYLLADFFNPQDVKGSLMAQATPLGKLFKDEQSILTNIDIIEAVLVEFPERIKKIDSLEDKDLIDYLSKETVRSMQFREAYIRSLYWRVPGNFENKSGKLKLSVRRYLNQVLFAYDSSKYELLNFLVSSAIKPFHPLSYVRLDQFLSKMTMSDRDLLWSEFTREPYRCQSIYKLVSWIETHKLTGLHKDQLAAIITVLGWVLTTTNRVLRDRATRCIFIIGRQHPETCFFVAKKMIEKDDPYVRERILAACYGICLFLNSNGENKKIISFAKDIYCNFFKKSARLSTTHLLIRDYCRGIIEVALLVSPRMLTKLQIQRIHPPYGDGGIRRWCRSKIKEELGKSPIYMDFENYTLGHLIPNRRNYDSGNKDFIRIKENVLWRIYSLGWSSDDFHDIDREISNRSQSNRGNYGGKIDRYGKKYSWIAYYEMLGLRADKKEVGEFMLSEDGSRDSYPELDPSFPIYDHQRGLLFKANLVSGPTSLKKWMVQQESPDIEDYLEIEEIDHEEGPWVLVHGIIGHDSNVLERRTTVFIEGVISLEKDRDRLSEFFETVKFPGNDNIPDLPEIHSLFFGEVGWREVSCLNRGDYEGFVKIPRGSRRKKISKRDTILNNLRIAYFGGEETTYKKLEMPEFIDVPIYDKLKVEIVARWLSAKDYSNSSEDNHIGLYMPNKKILKMLNLSHRVDSFDFNDAIGRRAIISRCSGDPYGTHENLLYVRKDLLDSYLRVRRKKLNLLIWGERQFWPKQRMDNFHRKDLSSIYENYENVFKKIVHY